VAALEQSTFENFEWIIVLNGELAGGVDFSSNVSNVKILSSDKKGVSAARNLGIENAEGEYIVFMDADDIFAVDFLEKSDAFTKQYTDAECIASSSTRFRFSNGQVIYGNKMNLIYSSGLMDRLLISLNIIGSPSGFVVKNTEIPYFREDINFFEDFAFYLDCLSAGKAFYKNSDAIYYYYAQDDITERLEKYKLDFIECSYSNILCLITSLNMTLYSKLLAKFQLYRLISRYRGKLSHFYATTAMLMILYPRYGLLLVKKALQNRSN
jgi:glycosyltransferase involved in cell wall biosynthesis